MPIGKILLPCEDTVSVPDYDNPIVIFQYDRADPKLNNPAAGLVPLKSLEARGGAYITNTSFTYDHVTSDIQWTAPEDGFLYIYGCMDYVYASDKDQATLRNGGTVWYNLMAIVKSSGGVNGCGGENFRDGEKGYRCA